MDLPTVVIIFSKSRIPAMSSFVKYFFLFSAAIASLQDRIAVDRFIYEKPHCSSVNECRGRNGELIFYPFRKLFSLDYEYFCHLKELLWHP